MREEWLLATATEREGAEGTQSEEKATLKLPFLSKQRIAAFQKSAAISAPPRQKGGGKLVANGTGTTTHLSGGVRERTDSG